MTMPIPLAGARITAAQLATLIPLTVVRSTNLARLNTTTLADDDTLFFNGLTASATYELGGSIIVGGSTTGDFKLGFTCSGTGATLQWGQGGFDSGGTTDDHSSLTLASTAGIGCSGAASQRFTPLWGYLNTGTGAAITFKLQWAQFVLDAVNNSTIFTNSQITLRRVA